MTKAAKKEHIQNNSLAAIAVSAEFRKLSPQLRDQDTIVQSVTEIDDYFTSMRQIESLEGVDGDADLEELLGLTSMPAQADEAEVAATKGPEAQAVKVQAADPEPEGATEMAALDIPAQEPEMAPQDSAEPEISGQAEGEPMQADSIMGIDDVEIPEGMVFEDLSRTMGQDDPEMSTEDALAAKLAEEDLPDPAGMTEETDQSHDVTIMDLDEDLSGDGGDMDTSGDPMAELRAQDAQPARPDVSGMDFDRLGEEEMIRHALARGMTIRSSEPQGDAMASAMNAESTEAQSHIDEGYGGISVDAPAARGQEDAAGAVSNTPEATVNIREALRDAEEDADVDEDFPGGDISDPWADMLMRDADDEEARENEGSEMTGQAARSYAEEGVAIAEAMTDAPLDGPEKASGDDTWGDFNITSEEAQPEAAADPDFTEADLSLEEEEAPSAKKPSRMKKVAIFSALAASVGVIAVSASVLLMPPSPPQETQIAASDALQQTPELAIPDHGFDLTETLIPSDASGADDRYDLTSDAGMGADPDPTSMDDLFDMAAAPMNEEGINQGDYDQSLSGVTSGSTFSDESMDLSDLFLGAETPAQDEPAAEIIDDLPPTVALTDFESLMQSVATLDENTNDLFELAVAHSESISELEASLVMALERAQRAEELALAQNQVLVRFVAAEEKLEIAEQLIVDLSRRLAGVESIDAADRDEVDGRLTDLDNQLRGLQRDVGMVARMAINGSPSPVTARSNQGNANFDRATNADLRSPVADPSNVPAGVAVGEFVNGYGTVLEIFATSDGGRMVVMENGSVIQN